MLQLFDHFYYIYFRIIRFFSPPVVKSQRVIIGAGIRKQDGFMPTDIDTLDVTKFSDWARIFEQNSLTHLVSEHLFEHLSPGEVKTALRNCYKYLQPSGRIRIAVPDKNRPDGNYRQAVAPPQDGHQMFFNKDDLEKFLLDAGFKKIVPLEYYTKSGRFISKKWDPSDGLIRRSVKYDTQKKFKFNNHYYTSLIIDAFK